MRRLLIILDHVVLKGARLVESLKKKSFKIFNKTEGELSEEEFAYEQERVVLPSEFYTKRSISSMRKPFKNNRKYSWNKVRKAY